MNANQKETFYSNFDFFLKKLNLKKSDIEKEAGVSQGYLSRFQKNEDSNNFPSVSFLEFCSRKFGTTIDDLLNVRFGSMSSTEQYIYNFIQKLISETNSDELLWTVTPLATISENVTNTQFGGGWNNFEFEREVIKLSTGDTDEEYELIYKPAKELNRESIVDGDLYTAHLSENVDVFLLPLKVWNKQKKGFVQLTLWLEESIQTGQYDFETDQKCVGRGDDDIFVALNPILHKLLDSILERQTHVQIDRKFKGLIENYLNPKPPVQQQNYSLENLDPDDLPF